MPEIRIRRGDTLLLQLTFQQGERDPSPGAPIDLTSMTLAAQVRDPTDNLVATLPIVRTVETGVATITQADTSQWPVGLLRADVKATVSGAVVHSETFGFRVERSVTA